ncbi:MAG: hypothetical protein UT28_C0001G0352 [Berkelbacteria bacterium GW2011_GWE1_39_12]|uniref:Uncharacterized protein n=1 Tax=Berkelbacteria bacterium GW2011_GWE1_39_12 TaxID=1618337 RepID=A0A0G4B2H1_9BACT|nr:MAG: hypothetical protein UT28_C0001G0352 [Berkelbacteria bacterium GW2011_GWE1_39_12]
MKKNNLVLSLHSTTSPAAGDLYPRVTFKVAEGEFVTARMINDHLFVKIDGNSISMDDVVRNKRLIIEALRKEALRKQDERTYVCISSRPEKGWEGWKKQGYCPVPE